MQNLKERKSIEDCTRRSRCDTRFTHTKNKKTFKFAGLIEKLDGRVYGKDYGLLLCFSFNCLHMSFIVIIYYDYSLL
jgi:hypothetical protein